MRALHIVPLALLALATAGAAHARGVPVVPEAAQQALQSLSRTTDTPWQVTWREETGTPLAVFGSRSAPLTADAAGMPQAVRKFLLDNGTFFRLRPWVDDCRFEKVVEMNGVRHYHMRQTYRGVPVSGASYNVAVDEQGRVVMITGSTQAELSGDVAAPLGADAALASALARSPGAKFAPGAKATLAIRAEDGVARPVYEVPLVVHGELELVQVDARSGVVAARLAQASHSDFMYMPYPRTDRTPKGSLATYALLQNLSGDQSRLVGQYVTVHNLSGADIVGTHGTFDATPPDSVRFAQVHAYYHADRFLAFVRSLGYSDATPVTLYANNPDPYSGVAYTQNEMCYFSRAYWNSAYDAGVIAHEVQHVVTARLGYTTASDVGHYGPQQWGAVQEGLSHYFQAAYTLDPEINVWPGGSAQCGSSPIATYYDRSVANSASVFKMANYNSLHVCGWPVAEDHTNSLIMDGALWDLRARAGADRTNRLALEAIPFLPEYPTMGCYFDAVAQADGLFHGGADQMSILIVRAARGLTCKPSTTIDGPASVITGSTGTWHVIPKAGFDCGIVPWYVEKWQYRLHCATVPCAAWTDWADDEVFTLTDNVANVYDLRAIVSDISSRRDTTAIQVVHFFYPLVASISGPSTVSVNNCQASDWTAVVSGHGPFAYNWIVDGHSVSTASTYHGILTPGDVTLTLYVTDAEGQQSDPATKAVHVTGICLPGDEGGGLARPLAIDLEAGADRGTHAVVLAAPRAMAAKLDVCDVAGRRVATLFDGLLPAGGQRVEWKAATLPSGVYFYRLVTPEKTLSRRFVNLR